MYVNSASRHPCGYIENNGYTWASHSAHYIRGLVSIIRDEFKGYIYDRIFKKIPFESLNLRSGRSSIRSSGRDFRQSSIPLTNNRIQCKLTVFYALSNHRIDDLFTIFTSGIPDQVLFSHESNARPGTTRRCGARTLWISLLSLRFSYFYTWTDSPARSYIHNGRDSITLIKHCRSIYVSIIYCSVEIIEWCFVAQRNEWAQTSGRT